MKHHALEISHSIPFRNQVGAIKGVNESAFFQCSFNFFEDIVF